MNPFANATIYGYKPEDIINFLINTNPKMAKKIKNAFALGYGADEIVNFLGNSFDGSSKKKDKGYTTYEQALKTMDTAKPESIKQRLAQKEAKEESMLDTVLDPNRMLSAGAGAAIGGLTGGVGGALGGALGGAVSYSDLQKRHREHIESGGNLSFNDFVKSLMKGASAAAGASQLPNILSGLASGFSSPTEQEEPLKSQAPQAPQATNEDFKNSYDIIKASGFEKIFNSFANVSDSPEYLKKILAQQFGDNFYAKINNLSDKGAERVIEEAYNYLKSNPQAPQEASKEAVPTEKAVEEAALEEMRQPTGVTVQPKTVDEGHPELVNYIKDIGKIDLGQGGQILNPQEIKAIKSSNVRYADYDADNKKLQVLFYPSSEKKQYGDIYEYENVPFEDVKAMMKGTGNAKTTGSNSMRAWFTGKNPSVGHAFDKFVKKKNDKGDYVYPVKRISEEYVKDKDLLKVRDADRVHKTIQYVEAFENITLKAQAGQRREGLQLLDKALKDLPNEVLDDMIFKITKSISQEKKEAKEKGKSVRYKGGKEKEIERRVYKETEEYKKKRSKNASQ